MKEIKKSRKGLTLVELVLSIAILGIIFIGFMPLFILSAKTNNQSQATLTSTYLGKDTMELVYHLSETLPYERLGEELKKKGYKESGFKNIFNYTYEDDRFLELKFSEEGELIKVLARIYEDKTLRKLQAQYESLYFWLGRDMIGEK